MNRKPDLTRIREKILATLPMLPDADLAHIASLCDGLLKLRAQEKRVNLQPQFKVQESPDALPPHPVRTPQAQEHALETPQGTDEERLPDEMGDTLRSQVGGPRIP